MKRIQVVAIFCLILFSSVFMSGVGMAQSPPTLFSFSLMTSTQANGVDVANTISSGLAQVGIQANVVVLPFSSLIGRLVAPGNNSFTNGGFDAAYFGHVYVYSPIGIGNPRPYTYGSVANLPPIGADISHWVNQYGNSLLNQFVSQPGGNWTAFKDFETYWAQQLPEITVNYGDAFMVTNPSIGGISASFAIHPSAQYLTGSKNIVYAVDSAIPSSATTPNINAPVTFDEAYYMQIYETPVTVSHQNASQFAPDLITSWTTPDNGITWYLHLRPDVKFSDGVTMNADDVVYTLWAYMQPISFFSGYYTDILGTNCTFTFLNGTSTRIVKAPIYSTAYPLVGHGFVKALNSSTVEVKTGFLVDKPYGLFYPETLSNMWILPMHVWSQVPVADWKTSPMMTGTGSVRITLPNGTAYTVYGPVGTGPYMWKQNSYNKLTDSITLYKNPYYWNATALQSQGYYQADTYTVQGITDLNSAISALKSGTVNILDWTYSTYLDIKSGVFTNQPWAKVWNVGASPSWTVIVFNMANPVFGTGTDTPLGKSNPSMAAQAALDVRQAIAHLINYTAILQTLYSGYGGLTPTAETPLYSLSWKYVSGIQPYQYDRSQALSLLQAAGYSITSPTTSTTTTTSTSTSPATIDYTAYYYAIAVVAVIVIVAVTIFAIRRRPGSPPSK